MSSEKLNIALVRRGYSPSGGAEAYLKRLGRGVVDLGHRAQLLTTNDWPKEQWTFGPITHLEARSAVAFAYEVDKLRPEIGCDVLMSLERIWSCDVFRAGDGVHRAWLTRKGKLELPLERVVHELNHKNHQLLQLEDALLSKRGAGRVIVSSEMVKTEIVDLYGYPAEKIDLIRNGVPLAKFRLPPDLREKSRTDLELQPDELCLLFAGSGWQRKGLRFAMKAMGLCRNPKLRLLVAGRGKTEAYFKSKRVRFLGEVDDLVPVYAAADIFILPTTYDPFSNACLEALACGLPVITTRANGFSEIIEDGVHGSIVENGNDLKAVRDAILFWSDTDRRNSARSTIIERASQFDISKNVQETLAVLVQAAASSAS